MHLKYRIYLLGLTVFMAAIPCFALADLKVNFLDIGPHGAALLQSDGRTMLIDAGGESDAGKLLSYLDRLDVQKIDLMTGTMLDENHIGGMDAVLEKYDVASLWLPGDPVKGQPPDNLLPDMMASGVKVSTPKPGDQISLGNLMVTVLEPAGQAVDGAPGFLLHIGYGKHSFLFMSDASAVREGWLTTNRASLDADVLSVGSYGSGNALSQALLDAVSPIWMISGDADNESVSSQTEIPEDPSGSGIYRLIRGESGTVTFTSDGTLLQAEHKAAGITIDSSVNLRKAPSIKKRKVATLAKGTVVTIYGTAAGSEGLWYSIEVNGKAGFVRGDLIEELSPEEAEKRLAQATPKPKQSNKKPKDSGGVEYPTEESPISCH